MLRPVSEFETSPPAWNDDNREGILENIIPQCNANQHPPWRLRSAPAVETQQFLKVNKKSTQVRYPVLPFPSFPSYSAVVLQCYCAAVLLCCSAIVLLCFSAGVLQCYCPEVLLCSSLQYYCAAVLWCCSAVVLQCYCAAVLLCCSTILLQCYWLQWQCYGVTVLMCCYVWNA